MEKERKHINDFKNFTIKENLLNDKMVTAEEFCRKIDDEEGEAWSIDYEELPKKND